MFLGLERYSPIIFSLLVINGCTIKDGVSPPVLPSQTDPNYQKQSESNSNIESERQKPEEIMNNSELKKIMEEARRRNQGLIIVSVINNYNFDLTIKIERMDDQSEEPQIVRNLPYLTSDGKVVTQINIFSATSCSGIYRLSISKSGGETYQTLWFPDSQTQNRQETFKLEDGSCLRYISLTFGTQINPIGNSNLTLVSVPTRP